MIPAVREFYEDTVDIVELEAGMPIPLAARPISGFPQRTPNPATPRSMDLLKDPGLYLFGPDTDENHPVTLDFSVRDRLDFFTWDGEKRLPRIATVHPYLGKEGVRYDHLGDDRLFDVEPKVWNLSAVLSQLKSVAKEAEIAVLPELALPTADALEQALAADPGEYPPIVVAGSAHLREQGEGQPEVRANESRIYLEGKLIGRHRKIQPVHFARGLDGKKLPRPLDEALTSEPKPLTVFSGEHTRMAIVICADAHHEDVYSLLAHAGVNLLLVPALTPSPGGFNGSICLLASQCQGVSVVANADAEVFQGVPRPFLAMVGLPRPAASEQSAEFPPPDEVAPCIGLIDPNLALEKVFRWI